MQFLRRALADTRCWEENGERLIEADSMMPHKTVRAAYRALDALESQGTRRTVVT